MRPNLAGLRPSIFGIRHPCLTLCICPNTLCVMQTVEPPINLENWIEKNRDKFKPPVSNRYLYDGRDFFVMVIKGPNARNDFHLVDSEEYFYQLKGDIKVRIREGDRIVHHFSQAMLDFWNDDARRTCKKCGAQVPKPEPVKPF